jgi:hypothetical protein
VRALDDSADGAQIHVPAPLGDVVGVTDIVSELRPFAAHFTYTCHVANSRIQQTRAVVQPQVSGFLQEACSAEGWMTL